MEAMPGTPVTDTAQAPLTLVSRRATVGLRLALVLLAALLFNVLAISALTVYALRGQRAEIARTTAAAREHALELAANRIEQALQAAVQSPFLLIENLPIGEVSEPRLTLLRTSFPTVTRVLLFDADLHLVRSFPHAAAEQDRRLVDWVSERLREEQPRQISAHPLALQSFVEQVGGQPKLFVYEAMRDAGDAGDQAQSGASGWALMQFDLAALEATYLRPVLAVREALLGVALRLESPDDSVRAEELSAPVGHLLPGWNVTLAPAAAASSGLDDSDWTVVSVGGGALLAIATTAFAVWWEVRREYALVELRNRFVASVSHELKTPLALIRMYAETLYLRRQIDPEKQHEYHRVMLREAERLSQMIGDVLSFARLRAGAKAYQLTATDMRATVSNVLERYRGQFEEHGVRIDDHIDDVLPSVAHDPNGVTQILINLVDNATKYAAAGGVIEVHLHNDGDWVELGVIDHGPGIAADEHARLRRAFERGTMASDAHGSGLGLALVEQIAVAHGAHLVLDSPENHAGVRAVVSFPVSEGR
ncbi:MAG: HAMP domain-containing histidine kinase [Gammaproteobacteria bacterium]|nr:HAMP domain-containing histidine kinase [Gammaproteobacteria bacterium]